MIIIIGAGPIGCFLGGLLAKAGKDVSIYEEHGKIGRPVQCTGVVTGEISKILKLDKEFIVNKVDYARVYSKNNKIEVPINDLVIDRAKFDNYLAKKAKKYGAKIYLNHKFIGLRGNDVLLADKKNKIVKVKAESVIGADGPLSDVARANKMFGKRRYYFGMQARIKGKFDDNAYETYLGSAAPGFFAWILPESKKVARIGVASKSNTKGIFKEFLKKRGIKDKEIMDFQAGLIPIFNKKACVQKGKVYLVGDAAGQVKATTGGGLVYGLRAAKKLAYCLLNNGNYRKELVGLNKELRIHLKIRQILDRFSDKDYNKLLRLVSDVRVLNILDRYGRDRPKTLILKTIMTKPSLLRYTTKFIN